jgi:hypothetical protein
LAAPVVISGPAPIGVFEVACPEPGNRQWDEDKVGESELVPWMLGYVIVAFESRSFRAFWRKPGAQAWHREAPDTDGPMRLPEFGIDPSFKVHSGVGFD